MRCNVETDDSMKTTELYHEVMKLKELDHARRHDKVKGFLQQVEVVYVMTNLFSQPE